MKTLCLLAIACLIHSVRPDIRSLQSSALLGGNGGGPFTDAASYTGPESHISAVTVWIDSSIPWISLLQFSYGSAAGTAHGTASGRQATGFSLGTNEFITSVKTDLSKASPPKLCYISFITNLGNTYSYDAAGCSGTQVLTTLGSGLQYVSGRSGSAIDAIQFYYNPCCNTDQLTTLFGGNGGGPFTDSASYTGAALTSLSVWVDPSRQWISLLQATYGTVQATFRGTQSGVQKTTIPLVAGEYITSVKVGLNTNSPPQVCFLQFTTSLSNTWGPYDAGCGANAPAQTTVSLGSGLRYLVGRSGSGIDALQFAYRTPCDTLLSTDLLGGLGGGPFSDSSIYVGRITAVTVGVNTGWNWISQAIFTYGTTAAPLRGIGPGTQASFSLGNNEYITAVKLATSTANPPKVCYLAFYTNVGNSFGPYDGSCGAGAAAAKVYSLGTGLAYVEGRSGSGIDALKFWYFP